MRLLLTFDSGYKEAVDQIDKVLAATEVFPYWAFWYPENEEGETRVRFIKTPLLDQVELIGKETEKHLASVTSIKDGDQDRTV